MPKLDSSPHTRIALAAFANCVLFLGCTADAQIAPRPHHTVDLAVGYVGEHSLRANSDQNVWLQGGSLDASVALWHGFGPTVNITGAHAGSVGTSGTPLSLVTVTAGPRLRVHSAGRWSPYGEVLVGFAAGFNSYFPSPTGTATSATSFALMTGGGLDLSLRQHLFLRPADVSYVRTQLPNGTNNLQNTFRLSAGLGWRFRER